MPTWADVVNIAPGDAAAFNAMDPAAQAAILAYATAQCNPGAWGALLNNGIVYLAAHLAKMGLMRGAGPLTAESVGAFSRSYGTIQGLKGSLAVTSYGAEYRRLLRLLPTALGAVY